MTFFMSFALRHAFVDVHFKVALHVFSGHGATDSSASEGYVIVQGVPSGRGRRLGFYVFQCLPDPMGIWQKWLGKWA